MQISIGVSTAQNIVNFIPAIQKNIKKLILLETKTAKTQNWSKGIQKVLEARKIEFETIDISEIDSNILEIQKKLEEFLKNQNFESILWNVGGGQKPQQFAIWEVFRSRSFEGKLPDVVSYANQDNSELELWKYENSQLTLTQEEISVEVQAKEIFEIFGFELEGNPKPIYKTANPEIQKIEEIPDLMKFQEFREFLTKLPKPGRKGEKIQIQDEELKKFLQDREVLKEDNLAIQNSSLQKITSNLCERAAQYFEKIVIQRVVKLLEQRTNNIYEVYANLEIKQNNEIAAEYDVLCVTKKGTLLALDAKTFDFKKKDMDARLYNLEKGSGFYRKFSAVLPFDYEDIDKNWFPENLRGLPFQLKTRNFNFYVISDSVEQNFWIKQNGKKLKKQPEKPQENGWVECKLLEDFIK